MHKILFLNTLFVFFLSIGDINIIESLVICQLQRNMKNTAITVKNHLKETDDCV